MWWCSGSLMLVLALVLAGCCAERAELETDLERFVERTPEEWERFKAEIQHFKTENQVVMPARLDLATGRWLEWRRREWWRLEDEFARLVVSEWPGVEKLTLEVGRYYGYNIVNFPRARQDILRFLAKADVEWFNLVTDIAIFLEWRNRELQYLSQDLTGFYALVDWEVWNLGDQVQAFLLWREREYEKLVGDGRAFFAMARFEQERLFQGLARFRAHATIEGRRLEADLAAFAAEEGWRVPRLVDGVWRFVHFRDREYERLRQDIEGFGLQAEVEMERLAAAIQRSRRAEMEQLPLLMAELDRFFFTYEREVRPLSEEVKRFWRVNIAAGHLLVEDLRLFYTAAGDEAADLEDGMRRFIVYGSVEWENLQAAVIRFATCAYDPAFGDQWLPHPGDSGGVVFPHRFRSPPSRLRMDL